VTGTGKGQEVRVILVFPYSLGGLGDPYIGLDLLKHRLGIVDTDDDFKLLQAIAATSYGINKFCGRQFNRATTSSARTYQSLRSQNLVMVDDFWDATTAVVSTDDDADGVYETVWSTSDYEFRPLNGVVDGVPGWPYTRVAAVGYRRFPRRGRAGVQLSSKWGWLAVPYPVIEATLIVAEEVSKLKDAPFGVAGFGEFGAMRVRMNSAAVTMLEPLRRSPVKVA